MTMWGTRICCIRPITTSTISREDVGACLSAHLVIRRNLVTVMLRRHVAPTAVRHGHHDAMTRPLVSERHQRMARRSAMVRNGQPARSSRGDSGRASVAWVVVRSESAASKWRRAMAMPLFASPRGEQVAPAFLPMDDHFKQEQC